MTDGMPSYQTYNLEVVRQAAADLRDLETKAAKARAFLYGAVSDAHLTGVRVVEIAEAAGWRTKKAVYDACRAARGS